ncbi:uncharacterized protein LOC112567938 isoform X3 [Pomacea canaliculata]|uniref:uncharacterized protein LOC112567938 isoform X3 n=1 Tax=Pomacea canaliculata TaxID=400727 RepID=UPI000D73A1D1|nr:uncharacterized protein LOC112567938 isoform X3 [Pomacea canaliculata]
MADDSQTDFLDEYVVLKKNDATLKHVTVKKELHKEVSYNLSPRAEPEFSVTDSSPFRVLTRKSNLSTKENFNCSELDSENVNNGMTMNRQGVAKPSSTVTNSESGFLDANLHLYRKKESEKIRGVLELSTFKQTKVPRIKVRLICIVDVSGSMLVKGDSQRKRSKIAILKNMIADVVDALDDDEDFVSVITFGEETTVVCPLTKVSASTRFQFEKKIRELDIVTRFSSKTNLSSAVLQAVDILHEAQSGESLLYRNCIIIFSDGEINDGVTDPKDLVHAVREKIRDCAMPEEFLGDLWVNISCVTTGSNVSHGLYLLSKMCGSDAYFFIDGDKKARPQTDMLIPLMLRKTACAQMVSVSLRAQNGAKLRKEKCSQEYSVRRKRAKSSDDSSMNYFLHDMPSGSQKTFQLTALAPSTVKEDFLVVEVQYVDPLGVLHYVTKSVRLTDLPFLSPDDPTSAAVVVKEGISTLRQLFQTICRKVATLLEEGEKNDQDTVFEEIVRIIDEGKQELNVYKNKTLLTRLTEGQNQKKFVQFAEAVGANLSRLQSMLKNSSQSRRKCWQYVKTVSSAVARELPTVSDIMSEPKVVCPIPKQRNWDSPRTHALSMYVFGQDDAAPQLHSAAANVAQTLADVLKTLVGETEELL